MLCKENDTIAVQARVNNPEPFETGYPSVNSLCKDHKFRRVPWPSGSPTSIISLHPEQSNETTDNPMCGTIAGTKDERQSPALTVV